ncbi:MAG: hypothetical protein HQL50_06220 [Magnetococcales bacterium]|nr:hypothetical protein [Magnetococcales bacterium]
MTELAIDTLFTSSGSEPVVPTGTHLVTTLKSGLRLGGLYVQALEDLEKHQLAEVFEDMQNARPVSGKTVYVLTSLFGPALAEIKKGEYGWIAINPVAGYDD